jgi:hypothetical protein
MLANPASANDAIVNERGSSVALSGPSWEKAMNSLSTARVPRRLPIAGQSFQETPRVHATGLPTQPSTVWRSAGNQPATAWIAPKIPFTRATSATNATSIASPSPVPRATAPTTFGSGRGRSSFTLPQVSGRSVSGSSSFAIIIVPGAVMMTAVSRWRASTPNAIYATMMAPEMWAMPDVITVISSDRVSRARNGRMVSGASACPMKMDAATFRLSAPLAPMSRFITAANARTTICITPMW